MIGRLSGRRAPILPREAGGEPWLAAVIAALCFLACLAAAGALAADRAAHGWARSLGAEATVQVRPRVGESGATAAARAAETLAGVTGVDEAEALDREAAEALLRPWLGEAVLPDLPLPYLVVVRLDRDQPASAVSLSRALAEAGVDATVDDHSLWRAEVERSAGLITVLAGAAFLLTAGAAAAAVVYATRAGMAAQAGVISILSLNGASDIRIAGLYQRRYGLLAAGAGAAGALAAMAALSLLRFLGGSDGITPALPVVWSDVLILSSCPALAATVALLAARLTALARLRGHD
ncbi:cell division protein [Brevundimonas viscosa]|uniref:Cell division transport system permease protein n=1 Tax=Brevundimonas viscosa TaxID=871741 RepID=A0A1I6PES4_9CAUL|nr:cell division protein [Brevundimonas viscosa]SFS38681.1 cell division transport system permease protein [Brevundimonas viscosa]